jgi:endo-1,3(4)-beta-glucanase
LTDRSAWKLTASHNEKELPKAIDGDLETRWDTRAPQAPGMWLQIDLPEAKEIVGLILDQGKSRNDYPRAYRIELSQNGTDWEKPILEGHEESRSTEYIFPRTSLAKSLRITQLGKTKVNYWSVHEMQILAPITKPEKR